MFGGAIAARRYHAGIRSLESSVGTLGTDLAGLDMRFRRLPEESSDTASRVGWASEDARMASKAVLGIEVGLMELERHGQALENYFASQVARVDRLILAMRAVLLDVGITFSHSHKSFRTLADMIGRSDARLRDVLSLQLVFGHWAVFLHAAQLSGSGWRELLRSCFRSWSAAASCPRVSASDVADFQLDVENRLSAIDDEIDCLNLRFEQSSSSTDIDAEHRGGLVVVAEGTAEGEASSVQQVAEGRLDWLGVPVATRPASRGASQRGTLAGAPVQSIDTICELISEEVSEEVSRHMSVVDSVQSRPAR